MPEPPPRNTDIGNVFCEENLRRIAMGPTPASTMLQDLIDELPANSIQIGQLVERLDTRAHGALLLLLALPMCIPNVPGISTIFGALMIAPALQLLLGRRRMWIPKQLRESALSTADLAQTLRLAIPTLKRVEVVLRPRFEKLTCFPITMLIGFQTLTMALILVLPIPFANWPPGMTVAMTALALLQRDGLLLLATIPAALISIGSLYFGARIGWELFQWLKTWLSPVLTSLGGW